MCSRNASRGVFVWFASNEVVCGHWTAFNRVNGTARMVFTHATLASSSLQGGGDVKHNGDFGLNRLLRRPLVLYQGTRRRSVVILICQRVCPSPSGVVVAVFGCCGQTRRKRTAMVPPGVVLTSTPVEYCKTLCFRWSPRALSIPKLRVFPLLIDHHLSRVNISPPRSRRLPPSLSSSRVMAVVACSCSRRIA